MPFGLTNAPATFQRVMQRMPNGLPFTLAYLDDIIVFSRDATAHYQHLDMVLKRLMRCNFKVNSKKCRFFAPEVKYLGFLVSGTGIKADPEKTAVVKNWPVPTNAKKLQRFLGLCSFYHRFLGGTAQLTAALYALCKKGVGWIWTKHHQEAFDKLKTKLTNLPQLSHPDSNLPFDVHVDASNVGLGAVLVQAGRPVAFASRVLTSAEKNYSATEKKCLAVVWALDHFHPYICGATLTVYSNHAALKWIMSRQAPRGRIARWLMIL